MPTPPPFSLITICHGRDAHLANLLTGVMNSSLIPAEIVVVAPRPADCLTAFPGLPIVSAVLELDSDGSFNVAAARNLGAKSAANDLLVFLDVDCVPAPDLFATLATHPAAEDALLMGDPHYLRHPLPPEWGMADLTRFSTPHPNRPEPGAQGILSDDYGLFWSLVFLMSKTTFEKVGGFDTDYYGYGAEDTDLAFNARTQNIPLFLLPAVAYHQQHTVYTPPVNHFSSIVDNCRVFHAKWGIWPMDNWLLSFADMGLIRWNISASEIDIVSLPTEDMLQDCARPEAAYA